MHRGLLFLLLVGYTCIAVGEPSVIVDCRTVIDDDDRLRCYDDAVDQRIIDTAPTATFGSRDPGVAEPPVNDEPKIESIDAVIASAQADARGRWVVELDNGQTWVQSDARRLNLASGDAVVIHKRRFGSFLLEKAAGSRGIAVKRID